MTNTVLSALITLMIIFYYSEDQYLLTTAKIFSVMELMNYLQVNTVYSTIGLHFYY